MNRVEVLRKIGQKSRRSSVLIFGGGIAMTWEGFSPPFSCGAFRHSDSDNALAQVDAAIGGKTSVNLVAGRI
jgi:3-dehydroquinate synthetase